MKKLLLIVLLLVLLLAAGLAGFLYFNADSLLARLRPELERIATQAVKTPVKLGELHLEIGLQPSVMIDGVTLGDSGDSRALSLGKALLSLDLMPLLSKELKITELKIEQPRITAVKSAGVIKIIGLPEKKASAQELEKERAAQHPAPTQGAVAERLPIAFALKKFILSGGEITFEDQTPQAAVAKIEIRDLAVSSALSIADNQLKLNDAEVSSLINQTLPVSLSLQQITYDLASTDTTLERIIVKLLETSASLDGTVNVNQMKGNLTLRSPGFDLAKLTPLQAIVPALKQFPLSGTVTPDLAIKLLGQSTWEVAGSTALKQIGTTVNNFTLSGLDGTVQLQAVPERQTAKGSDLTFTFQGAPMKVGFEAAANGPEVNLEKLELAAFSGTVSANAGTTLGEPKLFKTTANISSIDIDQALAALSGQKSSAISGTLESVDINLSGELGEALKSTTGGRITLKVKDATLKQVNLAYEAFKGILTLPIVGDRIMLAVPEEFREELTGADTKIRLITGTLNGASGSFSTNDFILLGSFFTIRGTGNLSMTGAVDLKTTISFNSRFSALLAERVRELKSALDKNGELTFPLAISGTAPKLRVVPDTQALLKLGAEAAVREGATRLLDRVLKQKTGTSEDAARGLGGLLGF